MKPHHDGGPAFPAIVPFVHSEEQGKDYPVFDDAGMSLRAVRSPEAPKITSTQGSGSRLGCIMKAC